MRWAEQQRMEWLAARRAPFNRSDLMKKFGISTPQASKDVQKFMKDNPGTWTYNFNKKRYERVCREIRRCS